MLRAAGLQVDAADNGQSALGLARSERYDLVLMDMQMPVMDGLAATRALRALPGWRDTPILALTANAFEDDRRACVAAGMTDFLAKPIEVDTLLAALLRWLPGERRPAGQRVGTPDAAAPARRGQAAHDFDADMAAQLTQPADLSMAELHPAEPPRAASAPTLEPVLDALQALLAVGDTAAIALFERHSELLHAALGPAGAPLERQIRQFAFDRADTALRGLRGIEPAPAPDDSAG
jgi:CheY-like chemotaxis protein